MKKMKTIMLAALVASLGMAPLFAGATESQGTEQNKAPKPYPLTTCLVSGEKFGGEMGKPVTLVQGDREIKFCCPDCIKDFKKNPSKYLKKLDETEKAASTTAPAARETPITPPVSFPTTRSSYRWPTR